MAHIKLELLTILLSSDYQFLNFFNITVEFQPQYNTNFLKLYQSSFYDKFELCFLKQVDINDN